MLSRSQAFAAAFSAKKALLNVNATVNAKRTFTFSPSMIGTKGKPGGAPKKPNFKRVYLLMSRTAGL